MYCNKSLKKYLNDLAAKIPAPGGGSAAALSASLGAALLSMVVNFTLGKSKYLKYTKRLKKIIADSERLRVKFLELVDLDVIAFKSKSIKKSLDVPLRLSRLCLESLGLCPDLLKLGNVNLISDVAVAAVLLESAFASACFNVKINLKYLNNPAFSKKVRKELVRNSRLVRRIREDTEDEVGKIIRG